MDGYVVEGIERRTALVNAHYRYPAFRHSKTMKSPLFFKLSFTDFA